MIHWFTWYVAITTAQPGVSGAFGLVQPQTKFPSKKGRKKKSSFQACSGLIALLSMINRWEVCLSNFVPSLFSFDCTFLVWKAWYWFQSNSALHCWSILAVRQGVFYSMTFLSALTATDDLLKHFYEDESRRYITTGKAVDKLLLYQM